MDSNNWTCSSCTCVNAEEAEVCQACDTPKESGEDEEEEYEGSDGEGEDMGSEEDDIDIRSSKGFDDIVGSALAKEAKKKAAELAAVSRKKLGEKNVGFLDHEEDNCTLRVSVPVNFLDKTVAGVWGVQPDKPIIVELKFVLERYSEPPTFTLYQSGDTNLNRHKMQDVSSFGLEWQLRARLDEWLNGDKRDKNSKPNWPAKDDSFIPRIAEYVVDRVKNCTKSCIICDGPLPFQMIKPAVCGVDLCVHSHEQYGLGADVASEIKKSPDVVDLLISFCYAIAGGDVRRFNPYPLGVESKKKDHEGKESTLHLMMETNKNEKNSAAVKRVLSLFPAVAEMTKYADTKALKAYLDSIDSLVFPLLRWIITSNRAHLALLEEKDRIKDMNTEYQYMFLSSPPEKEAVFQKLKKEKGAFWAFHGSSFANWHSILRIGLKNYSNTALMSTGAAYGSGIYLSPHSGTSLGYAVSLGGWDKSKFNEKGTYNNLQCLAICEVIDGGYKANPHYVIPDENHVMTRYFFIYNSKSTAPSIEAAKLKGLKSTYKG